MYFDYLKSVMQGLSNILYNTSQSDFSTKDDVLDSIKRMIENYNFVTKDEKDHVKITDWRIR